ncbi:MAG TPA: hypothetical protein VLU25_01000 [Acidobacteriota bacterium]|nr:hypothetical protein [Acidobacteriota bacterium]
MRERIAVIAILLLLALALMVPMFLASAAIPMPVQADDVPLGADEKKVFKCDEIGCRFTCQPPAYDCYVVTPE